MWGAFGGTPKVWCKVNSFRYSIVYKKQLAGQGRNLGSVLGMMYSMVYREQVAG